ncbi:hypothetical protein [Agaribacter marinus]|uniref:Uncharacterized protein n=1 Tax=Agaribacter marinus TaxID=1431249 RepID=A0AA37T2N0_9ALTE|nr:hypothetical protein [Agaribacter marinus]GLR71168.1 hypothetical protein GCM10007852_20760 [Agaribacter marinus]
MNYRNDHRMLVLKSIFRCSAALSALIFLQNTLFFHDALASVGGVHGPGVKPNDKTLEFRSSLAAADESTQQDVWTHRLHYQHSLNSQLRARLVLQYRDLESFEYDSLRAELLYNFKKKDPNGRWSSALRFDVRTNRGNRPEDYFVNWTNQWDFKDGWRARGLVILSRQFNSEQASSKTAFGTRASISKSLDNSLRVGIDLFDTYGEFGEFGNFNDQRHLIGPKLVGKLAGFSFQARYLAGVTSRTRDNNFSLFVSRSF